MRSLRTPLILLLTLILIQISSAAVGPVTVIYIENNQLILVSHSDRIIIQGITENLARISYQPYGQEDPNTLVTADSVWPSILASIDTLSDPIIFELTQLRFEIQRDPLRITAYSGGKVLFAEQEAEGFYSQGIKLNINPGNYYGITNRDHSGLTMNSGGLIAAGAQGGAGAPFIWTPDGWGLIADSDGGRFDISGSSLLFEQGLATNKQDIELFIIAGNPKDIFKGLVTVSGNPPLPPKFSFGFMNTEWGINQEELLNDVRTYREKEIPIDAYILDFDWMDWGADNYGEFRWNPQKFPSGQSGELKNELDSLGLKLFGIRKPRIHVNTTQGQEVNNQNLYYDIVTDYFSGQSVYRLDFMRPETRSWYWDRFITQGDGYNSGIIGFWNDEADEYGGNLMFMQMQRANFEGQRNTNNYRVWSINRNFYLGTQRFAYSLWSGDIATGFSSMAAQRTYMLTSINLGVPWWGMDIGGFNGTPTPENYYRWIQFGAFVPVFRVHGSLDQEREPWQYGSEAEQIAKKYIQLRYQLLPYIYSTAQQTHDNGWPMVRPLIMDYPADLSVLNYIRGWMFGDSFLVYPVVNSQISTMDIYLPQGQWIDYFHGSEYTGPASVKIDVTSTDIPLFVKSGSVIPTAPVGSFVDDPTTTDLIVLQCFGRGTGTRQLYEDDGVSYSYENSEYATTSFIHFRDWDSATLRISMRNGSHSTPERDYLADFQFTEQPDSVLLDGFKITKIHVDSLTRNSVSGWAVDDTQERVLARFPDDGNEHTVIVYFKDDLTPPQVDTLSILADTTIWLKFSEPVLIGAGVNSAENMNNYAISGDINVLSAVAGSRPNQIILTTTPHSSDDYTIIISGIADQHPNSNIMSEQSVDYSYTKTFQLVLQDGFDDYVGTSDTHIAEFFPNNNMGGHDRFEAARYSADIDNDDKHILIDFDISRLDPERNDILSADIILTLAGTRNGETVKNLACYRVTTPWNEGSRSSGIDGSVASPGEATWNSARYQEQNWDVPGGDIREIPTDIVEVANTPNSSYSWNILDALQFWLSNMDSSFGVLIREVNPLLQNGTKVFYSSEHQVINLRPKLVITYASPVTSIHDRDLNKSIIPQFFSLKQNYPNPFNPRTTIKYELPKIQFVTLQIFNTLGQLVTTLVSAKQPAGIYRINWDASDLSSGIYFYRLNSTLYTAHGKAVLLK